MISPTEKFLGDHSHSAGVVVFLATPRLNPPPAALRARILAPSTVGVAPWVPRELLNPANQPPAVLNAPRSVTLRANEKNNVPLVTLLKRLKRALGPSTAPNCMAPPVGG